MGYQLLKSSLHRKSFLSCLLSRSQKVNDINKFQGMHTALLKMVFTKIFLVKKKSRVWERKIYIPNFTWICKCISILSLELIKRCMPCRHSDKSWWGNLSNSFIGYSSLWQFILIKKGLIQWFLHSCQVFTVGSHQTWWYSKHIKW